MHTPHDAKPLLRSRPLAARGLATGLALALSFQAASAAGALPQRNLVVAWRLSTQGQASHQTLGVRRGQVIVDSQGGVLGRTSIGMETVQTEGQADTVQEVRVLNGGRASLYIGRTQPHTVWQWAWNGQAGANGVSLGAIGAQAQGQASGAYAVSVVPQTVWIDVGQGLEVRPRWPGGRAPVTIELTAQVRQPAPGQGVDGGAFAPDGQTRRLEAGSTLSLPLGQWVVVARSGTRAQAHQQGSLSTRDLDEDQAEQLEIRVTAP